MPIIKRFDSYVIRINPRDHSPPHFHVVLNDGREAWVRIDNCQVIHGDVRSREISAALLWARKHREELAAKFEELQR
jgi:hypothetical protein